jgi:hypothetical protein
MFVNDQRPIPAGRLSLLVLALLLAVNAGCDPAANSNDNRTLSGPPPAGEQTSVAETHSEQPAARTPTLDKTFDDLAFDLEPGDPFEPELLTPEIEELIGKRIRIRGYMLPDMRRNGIKQFVLIRDDQYCCFGPGARLYHNVRITMDDSATVKYTIHPITVTGILKVEPFVGPDGNHWAVYTMDSTLMD